MSGSWFAATRIMLGAIALASCQPIERDAPGQAGLRRDRPVFASLRSLGDRPALVVAALQKAGDHGLDPDDYLTPELIAALDAARTGNASALRRADTLLAAAFGRWAQDLAVPRGIDLVETDPGAAAPPFDGAGVLQAAAASEDLGAFLDALQHRHPIYDALVAARRSELAAGRDTAVLARNLARARALPAAPRGKHVVVDAAGARLWMYDGNARVGTMKVVIGRPDMPTPVMSGVIRHVVVRPYWNLPVDIVRDSIAPEVVRTGLQVIRERDLEILSDWTPTAQQVAARSVDWRAVAAGARELRVRQRPGPGNMMGRIKFMLPNDLGIYLHDTPKRSDFAQGDRAKSSGCVRVEDAGRLAQWLFDGESPMAKKGVDRTVDLPKPVPVYISYFTVSPDAEGAVRVADIYGRDAGPHVAAMERTAPN